jgi:Zn-dependent M28 family amino/carboxypeptidase
MKLKHMGLGMLMCMAAPAMADTALQPSADYIQSHLTFLASDLLEGRDTGSKGHEIASFYIATEFAKYGLKPAGTDGYMQRVSFRKALLEQSSPLLTFATPDGDVSLDYPKDYLTGADSVRTQTSMSGELVFVGYGIIADEFDHNDYADIDVDGKIVVMLSGKPKSFPSEEGAHLGSRSQKAQYAVDNGAIGIITVTTPTAEKVRPYQNLLSYIHTPSLRWLDKDGKPANTFEQLQGSAYLSLPAAEKLFASSPVSLEDIYAQLEKDEAPKGFALPISVELSKTSTHDTITSPNVVGYVEGSDPELKNEYVVFSAHSDHIGFAKTVKEDKINNGAMDNASGTSIMLETARLFGQMKTKPKRSILFVSVTAEEKGLLGADYFANNPTVPLDSMVANVNLDMPILTYNFADVIAFGANHSDMKTSVEQATANVDVSLSPDPWPEQALFTRSDHYAFVKKGIPSIFLVTGLNSADPEIDGSKVFGTFLSTHYHKPTDDINQPFNWDAAVKFASVNAQIGKTLADQTARPKWNEDSFFKRTFAD